MFFDFGETTGFGSVDMSIRIRGNGASEFNIDGVISRNSVVINEMVVSSFAARGHFLSRWIRSNNSFHQLLPDIRTSALDDTSFSMGIGG